MNPDERAVPRADLLKKEIVYDGEGYSRQSIEHMLVYYQRKHTLDLEKFGDLSRSYERLSREMTQDVSEYKSAVEYLGNIVTFDEVGTNIKGLLHKIPIIRRIGNLRELDKIGDKAHCRTWTIGNTRSTGCAAVSAMRLAPHDGHQTRPLQEKPSRRSCPQEPHRRRKKPRARMPQSKKDRNSSSTKRGTG